MAIINSKNGFNKDDIHPNSSSGVRGTQHSSTSPKTSPTLPSNTYHPIVGNRVIEGEGTSVTAWQNWHELQALPRVNITNSFGSPTSLPQRSTLPRVCVFAPHPDDEILGCGGLLQQLTNNGNPILLIYVTNGTQSHPDSLIYPPEKLNIIRPNESLAALEALGIEQQVTTVSLNLEDGNVYNQQPLFYQKLANLIEADDLLITPFAHDGHPDHEATGQVVTTYARQHNIPCYQVLIWAWHWAKPADSRIPWHTAHRLDLTPAQVAKKTQAIHCFQSQISVDESTGNPPILSTQTIARITQPWEVYLYE